MNKTELVAAIADKAGIAKKDAEKALTAFVDTVVDELKTVVAVVCTACSEGHNRTLKIFYVVYCTRILSIFKYLIDIVDRGLGS